MAGRSHRMQRRSGYTLPEVLIAGFLMVLVIGGTLVLYLLYQRMWRSASLRMESDRLATLAVNRMVYGIGERRGLRMARAGSVLLEPLGDVGWNLIYVTSNNQTNRFEYRRADREIRMQPGSRLVGEHVDDATAALNPPLVNIAVRVALREGRFAASSELSTSVRCRN